MLHRLILFLLLMGASSARAIAPTTDVISVDFTYTPPILSGICGFDVARHVQGTITISTFSDAEGNFVRELDRYNLIETISANGKSLVGRTVQNISVNLLPDGFYTVAFAGTDFLLPVPGKGLSFGSVGRLVLLFAADNTLIDVLEDAGHSAGDFESVCEALAP